MNNGCRKHLGVFFYLLIGNFISHKQTKSRGDCNGVFAKRSLRNAKSLAGAMCTKCGMKRFAFAFWHECRFRLIRLGEGVNIC